MGWGQHSMISIGPYELCLFPSVAKGWRQKEINPFEPETTESAFIIIISSSIIDIIMSIKQEGYLSKNEQKSATGIRTR